MIDGADDVTAEEAMMAGFRGRRGPWENLERVWPDTQQQLGRIYDSVNDAITWIGAGDWTQAEQLKHFTALRTDVDNLGIDLDSQAEQWEEGEW